MSNSSYLLVADAENHRIRKIDLDTNETSHVAGNGLFGYLDGDVNIAEFRRPNDVIEYTPGVYLVADTENNVIRKIQNGIVSTFIGSGKFGYLDGHASNAQFKHPTGLIKDEEGNLFIVDKFNHCIRKVDIANMWVTTFSGNLFFYY